MYPLVRIRKLIASGDPLFDATGELWELSADAQSLEPRQITELR